MSQPNIDDTLPTAKWEFDESVTKVFDSMLENSIPSYHTMRYLTFALGKNFVRPDHCVVDLGASLGRSVEDFCHAFKDTAKFSMYEISEPMRKALMENPLVLDADSILQDESIVDCTRFGREGVPNSLILSVLTLQFTPIEYRAQIVQNVYDSLEAGGAFILIEKVLGSNRKIDDLLVDTYYQKKAANGYTRDQINAKRKSLEGVLVPLQASWNERMLRDAGFTNVECFFRDLNFAGWIAIK